MSIKKQRVSKKVSSHVIIFTDISYKEIINLHFNEVSTSFPKSKGEQVFNNSIKKHSEVDFERESDVNTDKKFICFLDSKKKKVKYWPTMIDCANNFILPLVTDKPCRNCHHSYNTHPIGCPINYHILTEENPKKKTVDDFLKKYNFISDKNDYFETECMFCSMPCVKSYIMSCLSKNPLSYKYCNSLSYTSLMYKKIHDIQGKIPHIHLAHPITTITSYGGHLTIDEYRASTTMIRFDESVNIRRPIMFPSFPCIEELKV